jgi:hypothetical protein
MSILLDAINGTTEKELESLGKTSNKCREAGAHLVTVEKAFIKATDKYEALTVLFKTEEGEELRVFEFLSTPQDESAEAISKAEAANKRVIAIINRIAHAAGLKDAKQVTAGATADKDEKGEDITVFPKLSGKKLTVISFTEIQPSQDEKKAYAVQTVDTFNFLDKTGKDGFGKEIANKLGEQAKLTVKPQFRKEAIPAVVAKLAQVQEQLANGATTTVATAQPTTDTTTEISDDDI